MNFLRWKRKSKREHDRTLCSNTSAFLKIQDQEYSCAVENISMGGALLSINNAFSINIGDIIEIQIPFSDSSKYVTKTAQVKRLNKKNIAIKFMW